MLNFCSLYSGSSGNSLFVQNENTNILIDAGESAKKIVNALSSINVPIEKIDAIVVTHEHLDHVKSIGTLSSKYNIPIYATEKTWSAMPVQSAKIDKKLQRLFSSSIEEHSVNILQIDNETTSLMKIIVRIFTFDISSFTSIKNVLIFPLVFLVFFSFLFFSFLELLVFETDSFFFLEETLSISALTSRTSLVAFTIFATTIPHFQIFSK